MAVAATGTTYTTKQNEVVDAICHRHYGRTKDVTEIVLAANPGLAALGPILPFATRVVLPAVQEKTRRKALIGLWD